MRQLWQGYSLSDVRLRTIKHGLVFAWSVWFTLVLASNVCDALKTMRLIGRQWPFASGNSRLIADVTSRFGVPPSVNRLLFGAVIVWQAVVSALFWRATACHGRIRGDARPTDTAFAAGLALWLPLIVADELFVAYESGVEASHVRMFVAQLASLLSIHLLPD
jgi:hypothetical protein